MSLSSWLRHRFPAQTWLWARLGLRLTRAGMGYLLIWLGLLAAGLYQQYNLVLLTAGLAAGPLVASLFMSAGMLRRVRITRRVTARTFAGEPLVLDYTLKNERLTTAALAVEVQEELSPNDRSIPDAASIRPVFSFERVAAGEAMPLRWQGPALVRGRYTFAPTDLVTRSPFGLVERRIIVDMPQSILVYPKVGAVTRRWQQLLRSSRETQRGKRHDRTAQQQEYHGLREYRSGDSPRWIHWRTTARTGELMVKEFEQENNQQIAVVLDPWLPRTKVSQENRLATERAIQFAATVCVDACRRGGRSILLGCTGTAPEVRQGAATVRLLHELLELLALTHGSPEGKLVSLFEALPPPVVRDALIVIVTTRHVDLEQELKQSARLAEATMRGLGARVHLLNVTRGDLEGYVDFGESPSQVFASNSRETDAGTVGGVMPEAPQYRPAQ